MNELTVYHIKDELKSYLELLKANNEHNSIIKQHENKRNINIDLMVKYKEKIYQSLVIDKQKEDLVVQINKTQSVIISLDNDKIDCIIQILDFGKLD